MFVLALFCCHVVSAVLTPPSASPNISVESVSPPPTLSALTPSNAGFLPLANATAPLTASPVASSALTASVPLVASSSVNTSISLASVPLSTSALTPPAASAAARFSVATASAPATSTIDASPVASPIFPSGPMPSFFPFANDGNTKKAKKTASDSHILKLLTNKNEQPLISNPASVSDAMARLFDQLSFRNWNIEMTPADVSAMNMDPTLGRSFPCSITSNYGTKDAIQHTGPSLGCKYKGSVGSLRLCLDTNHQPNGDCRKLSWSVEIDGLKGNSAESTPTIHGADSLQFGGCPVDWSMMSERMSYTLLNHLNITASMATHAKLFLNGKFLGVYSFIQPVDGVFTEQHFSSDAQQGKDGLYKEVWFNKYGMQNMSAHDGKDENDFMRKVMKTIGSTALTQPAAAAFFAKYFDTKSIVDVTAFNSVIGNTDDWRQRHNFFWYVKDLGAAGKKLVLLPWDYDRLYDSGALTRGALAGTPWWDIKTTATPARCATPIKTPEQMAEETTSSPAEIALWTGVFSTLPPDVEIPVTCDKITKLMALGLGPQIRARTRELLNMISLDQIRGWFNAWNRQIEEALKYDPDGPKGGYMQEEQGQLISHLEEARAIALSQANQGDATFPLSARR